MRRSDEQHNPVDIMNAASIRQTSSETSVETMALSGKYWQVDEVGSSGGLPLVILNLAIRSSERQRCQQP